MSRHGTLVLLAGTVLVLTAGVPSAARADQPPPGVVGGTYDSYGRNKGPDNRLPQNPRTVQIQKLQPGAIRITSYRNGQLQGTQLFISPCGVNYDGSLVSYFQDFVPPKGYKGPIKGIKFVFRINDPIGDYDVYYTQTDGSVTSEVLKRR